MCRNVLKSLQHGPFMVILHMMELIMARNGLYVGLTRNFISFHFHSPPKEQVNNVRMVVRIGQHPKLCLRWSSVHKSRGSVVCGERILSLT